MLKWHWNTNDIEISSQVCSDWKNIIIITEHFIMIENVKRRIIDDSYPILWWACDDFYIKRIFIIRSTHVQSLQTVKKMYFWKRCQDKFNIVFFSWDKSRDTDNFLKPLKIIWSSFPIGMRTKELSRWLHNGEKYTGLDQLILNSFRQWHVYQRLQCESK